MFSTIAKYLSQKPALFIFPLAIFLAAGCQSDQSATAPRSEPSITITPPVTAQPETVVKNTPGKAPMAVRIKAGGSSSVTDSQGNVWLADQGFNGGETIERADLTVTNTAEQEIYRSERYSMDSFSWPLPNGNYLVKLHFCETYDGITGPDQRVFSFNVQGHQFNDFDVWVKAGGPNTAYVEQVPVEIKDGKLLITFTGKIENPQINGIEIIPQP